MQRLAVFALLLVSLGCTEGKADDTSSKSAAAADEATKPTPEIPITTPATGEVGFACGMDMYKGKVVVH